MKRLFPVLNSCLFLGLLGSSCTVDTHYDSISTDLTVDIVKQAKSGEPVKIRQRFIFDRDLVPLSSMQLVEAWIDSPVISDTVLQNKDEEDVSFNLDIVQRVEISLVEDKNAQSTFWLYAAPGSYSRDHAVFSEIDVGSDIRNYMENETYLEIEAKVTLQPYQVMRYWRDVCDMSETCELVLPFSMQFKMED